MNMFRSLTTVVSLASLRSTSSFTTIATNSLLTTSKASSFIHNKKEPCLNSIHHNCGTAVVRLSCSSSPTEYEKLADPAPGSPFHLALPVHDLDVAKNFYGNILGCAEGRSSEKWQDYSLNGHQIVCHWVGNDYRCQDFFNPVDGDDVPVPHFGLALTEEEFHDLANRVRDAGIEFIIEPHLRFKGQPGEQWTMFFKDPSNNNLEFKAMTKIDNLFAKYNVANK